jgi:thymidylate synthase (FAD)
MKIVTSPRVVPIGVMKFIEHPEYKIPADGNDAVKLGAFAAKACYHSFGVDGRPNMVNQEEIVKSRHGSVLEHYHVSVFIEGISRGCSLELLRHRLFNVSQRSTRYTDESERTVVAEPELSSIIEKYYQDDRRTPYISGIPLEDHELYENFRYGVEEAFNRYDKAVNYYLARAAVKGLKGTAARKYARGKARDLLPHALETKLVLTGNIRNWRHVLEMRSDRFAETEIRRLAAHFWTALVPHIEFYLRDYVVELIDDFPEFTTQYRKV